MTNEELAAMTVKHFQDTPFEGDYAIGYIEEILSVRTEEIARLKQALKSSAEFFDILECEEEANNIRELLK